MRQVGDAPALLGVKEPVLAACRCGAVVRLSLEDYELAGRLKEM